MRKRLVHGVSIEGDERLRRKTKTSMNATVFHDIRTGNRIFLCISAPATMDEAAKLQYSVERELDMANCTPETIKSLVAAMESESGLKLELSEILRNELGL